MDNSDTLATMGAQNIARRQKKNKKQIKNKKQRKTGQKTKKT